ncbi:hypothetical protein [Tateyamaria sp. syn59]|uniref:hypothetical protein n=1 Tax=Tateyamaria sp. syn59 TaxID=2576942 RepID=UPI0011BF39ED|nr:hypothetical protein [Tateyamaria sp. syn59]
MIIALNGTVSCGKSYLAQALSDAMPAEFRGEPPMSDWPNATRLPQSHRDIKDLFLRSWRVSNLLEAQVLSKLKATVILDSVFDILHHTIVTQIEPGFFGSGPYASVLADCARLDHERLPTPDVIVNVVVSWETWQDMCNARGLDDFYPDAHLAKFFALQDVFHDAACLRGEELDIPVLCFENRIAGSEDLSELAKTLTVPGLRKSGHRGTSRVNVQL